MADHERRSSYSIRVKTTDKNDLTFEKPLLIQVKDINEAPSNISLNYSAGNLESDGSLLGTLGAYDQDAGDEHSFALVDGTGSDQNDLFRIDGDEIHLKSPEQYETIPAFSIRVKTTDEAGLTHEEVIKNEKIFLPSQIEDGSPNASYVADFIDSSFDGSSDPIILSDGSNQIFLFDLLNED